MRKFSSLKIIIITKDKVTLNKHARIFMLNAPAGNFTSSLQIKINCQSSNGTLYTSFLNFTFHSAQRTL